MFDVEQQMERVRRHIERSIEADVRKAMKRINAPTLTERAEIAAGVRLSPEEVEAQRIRESWARLGEAFAGATRSLEAMSRAFGVGVERGLRRHDTPGI